MSTLLSRATILSALRQELEPLAFVNAMWEAGAAAFHRVDAWSDIDLYIDVDDEAADEIIPRVDALLATLSPIALRYELPQPSWHGHLQVFYTLANASPFLMIDLVVMRHSNPAKFLEREIHGEPLVHFDKVHAVDAPPLNMAALQVRLSERLATLRVLFDLNQILTSKELNRGNAIEAVAFYHGYTLRPLLEVLRIRHDPTRYNFHTRYVYYYLPAPVVERLESLFFVKDTADLAAKLAEAQSWFWQALVEAEAELAAGGEIA